MVRIFKFTNDGTATFQFYHFDSLNSTNEMGTIKDKLIKTDLCKYPNQDPIISWKWVKCRRQSEVECGPRVYQHLVMTWMTTFINDIYPNFSHLVKEHGSGTNYRNVQLWLQFCIKTSTITMPLN